MNSILIAMPEEIDKMGEKINIWERVISLVQISQGLSEILEKYVNNPYRIEPLNNAINIDINLLPEITLPMYISNTIFRTEVAITGLKIYKATVELRYRSIYGEDTTRSFSYIMNLNSEKIPIKDLFMLLYIFVYMSEDNINELKDIINAYFNRIELEKKLIRNLLNIKGIKIEN